MKIYFISTYMLFDQNVIYDRKSPKTCIKVNFVIIFVLLIKTKFGENSDIKIVYIIWTYLCLKNVKAILWMRIQKSNCAISKVTAVLIYTFISTSFAFFEILNQLDISQSDSIMLNWKMLNNIHTCLWHNSYRKKWIQQTRIKCWMRLFAFHIGLIPLRKVWIQLFSLQLGINSWADWTS